MTPSAQLTCLQCAIWFKVFRCYLFHQTPLLTNMCTYILHDWPPELILHFFCYHRQKLPGPVLLQVPSFPVKSRASQAKAGKAFRPARQQYLMFCPEPLNNLAH